MDATTPSEPNAAETAPATDSPGPRLSGGTVWTVALLGAVVVGLLSWLAGETTTNLVKPQFRKPDNWAKMGAYDRENYLSEDEKRQMPGVQVQNVGLVLGALAAGLSAVLGVAGGLANRSIARGVLSAFAGLVVGLILLVPAGMAVIPYFYQNVDAEMPLKVPLITHAALFGAVGAGAGLALGLGLNRPGSHVRGFLGGLIGGLIGAVVFEMLMALVFANNRLLDPIPKDQFDRLPRLAMHVSAGLCIAALAVATALSESRRRPTTPASTA